MKKPLLQFLLMGMAVLVHATQQTITLPVNGYIFAGCQVDGTGGNDINNASFLQVPGSFPGEGQVTMLVWNCVGFNQYFYYNSSASPDDQAGWYDVTGNYVNLPWNPGEGMVIKNSSAALGAFTLNGASATPVLPPTNSCGCGEWSLLSSQTNSATSTYQQVVGVAPVSGSEVSFNYSNGPAAPDVYLNGNWTPAAPVLTNGQAAFFFVPCATTTNCITITCSNLLAYALCGSSNCAIVPLTATAIDNCCTNDVTLQYYEGTTSISATGACFNVDTTNTVEVVATDGCSNMASSYFTVAVIQNTNPPVILSCPTNVTICTGTGTGAIIVDSDEWVLSDSGFNSEGDGAVYATNCAAYLTGGHGTNILIYSSNFGLDGAGKGSDFINALQNAGYNVTIDTPPTPALTVSYLSGFNAVFLGGDILTTNDLLALEQYVCGGGGVYIAAGTGDFPVGNAGTPAAAEAAQWNIFLNPFGLTLANTYNGIENVLTVTGGTLTVGPSPVMAGVTALDYINGNDVSVIGGDPLAQVIAYSGTDGLIGVSGCNGANNGCGVMPDVTGLVIASGGGTVTQSIPPGTMICNNTNVTFTVSNLCGEIAQSSVPCVLVNCASNNCLQIECWTNIVLASCTNVQVYYYPTAIDTCCSNWGVTCSPPSGSYFEPGASIPVTCVATDSCGNSSSCSFTVTVLPGTNCCSITILSSNLLAYALCGSSNCATVPLTATTIDNCCTNDLTLQYYEGDIAISAENTCFNVGTTPVTIVAVDGCGNAATNMFDVIVRQTTGITLQTVNETVHTCSDCTTVPFQVTVVDPCCSNGVSVSYDYPTNYCFPVNTTNTVEVLATDLCGDTNTASFTVTVLPGTNCAPCLQVVCPTNMTVECGTLWTSAPPVIVSSCCPSNSIFLLRSVTNGTCPKYITNNWQVSDSCGDTDTCRQVITVVDTTPPVITGGTNPVTGTINTNCELVIPYVSVSATDSCTPLCSLGEWQSPAANTIVPGPNAYVTVTVTDLCGNASQCQVYVEGVYTRGPIVTWPTQLISSNCLVPCVDINDLTIQDCGCSPDQIQVTQSPECDTEIGPVLGQHSVTVTVTDCHGLSVSRKIPLTVIVDGSSFLNVLTNTGIGPTGNLLPDGAVDPHYTLGPVTGSPPGYAAPKAVVVNDIWSLSDNDISPTPISEWIAPTPYQPGLPWYDQNIWKCQPGYYTYTNQFTLPAGMDPTRVSIMGRWAADDGVAALYCNGYLTIMSIEPCASGCAYDNWHTFCVQGPFNPPGIPNTLCFVVTNATYRANGSPVGLRIEYLSADGCSTCAPPTIVSMTRPSWLVSAGSTVTFNVQANGTPPMGYQWMFNGNAIPGATSASLQLQNVAVSAGGNYTVIVSDPCGTVTNTARLWVEGPVAWTNGWWNFNVAADPLSATFGPDLSMNGLDSGTNFSLALGTTEDLGLPNPGGQVVNVLGINPQWPATLTLPPILPAGSTGNTDYSVIMDIYQPDTSQGTPSTLFESAGDGSGIALTLDASNYLDITGTADGTPFDVPSTVPMTADTWHRVALVVAGPVAGIGGSVVGYLDGGPFTTEPAFPFNCPCCFLNINSAIYYTNSPIVLSGTNGATSANGEVYVSSLQFHATALAPQIIAALGAPDSGPLPDISNVTPPSSAPPLSASVANDTVSFTWSGSGYVLQETTDLASDDWVDSTLPFTETATGGGGGITTTAVATPANGAPAKFYRLVFRP